MSYLHKEVLFVAIFAINLGSFSFVAWRPQFSILDDAVWHLDVLMFG